MKVKLTLNIKRTLARIEQTLENDAKKGKNYPGTLPAENCLKRFRKLKSELETGEHYLINCEVSEIEDNLIKIYDLITDYYYLFDVTQILKIENVALIEESVRQRLKKYLESFPDDYEANCLRNFLNNALCSSWECLDRYCEARVFKSINTMEEYNEILRTTTARDITNCKNRNPIIRIAFYKIFEEEIIEKRGLKRDWERFLEQHGGENKYKNYKDVLEKYKCLLDIKSTGVYYVFIPEI